MTELTQAELSVVDEYSTDMAGMTVDELKSELSEVTYRIETEEGWQEALTARLKQLE